MTALDQAAALVALLREQPRGMSWHEIAARVAFSGDAQSVWEEKTHTDTLVPDPRLEQLLGAARSDVVAWHKAGLRFVTVLDPDYPARLRDVRETPPFLFARGDLRHDDAGMSVVGSRRASDKGRRLAAEAAKILVKKGLTVIAGLAAGIDTAAHRAALDADGRTVAFIGTGITRYYPPENKTLQDEIAHRGLVLSQFWPDAAPSKLSFPIRNASMSGYGLATIVIEAGETSGTRIQARLAVEHGRPVILMADVAKHTEWGAALMNRPGVHVASTTAELELKIDRVLKKQDSLRRALSELAG
ncbi:DNA-processing protein DprA [Jiangella muralis]|uniref:DNA-processing protein DprA n=1 Tax=Jiangella muralis TaxID=702383 RepID=UPI00069D6AEA|nr:DNA-processing protein DprA [Jiangella muralis]